MDPTNSIVWTRKNFIGSLMPCRVGFQQNLGELYIFRQEDRCEARVGFQQTLGQKSVMDPSCQCHFPWPQTATGDITNKNQPLLFFHMDPTNSIAWTRKSFNSYVVSCRVDFQQNLGQKSVMDPSCQCDFLGHKQPQGT
jgi:hypothetical protein